MSANIIYLVLLNVDADKSCKNKARRPKII